VPWLILVPILAFFLLKDAEVLRKAALHILPRGRLRSRGTVFLVELNDTLAAYMRAQVTACLLIGIVCTTGFLVIGVPYAVVFGIAAGLLEFIPLASPLAIGALAVSFAAFQSFGQALAVSFFLVVIERPRFRTGRHNCRRAAARVCCPRGDRKGYQHGRETGRRCERGDDGMLRPTGRGRERESGTS
jgi:hypothetical protein